MSDSIRIRTTPNGNDKYLKVKLEQDFDFIEILSLKISQEDVYRKFCSDYGTIVGRVTVNNGFGVPNAKVSVFIPLDDIDKLNPEVKGLYPYEIISDTNSDGLRYNLLTKEPVSNNDCFTPTGSFPSKREVLDNPTMMEIYCKYYKFTTTTNHAGDFMIFGVPIGTYTVHMDADISDMGVISQRPYDLISQGTPKKLFESSTKFKTGDDLNKLIQIKTLNAGVNVQPFWGDIENCEVGITRLDFSLNSTVTPSAIFMGSIFGDQDKNSINKNCRPRKKLGELCEQISGEGTINMIRKTIDGDIEEFDVEGGRVIDENGAWAYQIPMNLDYVTTNESGDLIPSSDPNVGIATRASVRFKIGLDETGGEGRIRTRAKYLVPNNPKDVTEVDYTFGAATDTSPATKDSSFRDMYWNKIYSVSNYIPRYQPKPSLNILSFTGIKNVDGCAGDKTPFPYNRVDININPIFFIVCIIINIISTIIWMVNKFIIPIINAIIDVIRALQQFICNLIDTLNAITIANVSIFNITKPAFCDDLASYVRCMTVECDNAYYAPGCKFESKGFIECSNTADGNVNTTPSHYPGDTDGHSGTIANNDLDVGLADCLSFKIADSLNMFKFNFYNDWVNGSLFSFLLKYKKKRRRKGKSGGEKFCEYECYDGNFTPIDGIDVNQNGTPDNKCNNNYFLDDCFQNVFTAYGDDSQYMFRTLLLNDGLVKKVDEELIYAATTHIGNMPLFATDIINLGSVFECDWQGIPKLNDLLIPTSYKIPPDTVELSDDGTLIETCGMVSGGGVNKDTDGLFFSLNCVGLHVNYRQCLNIRHISEMGVGIDTSTTDINGNTVNANCIVGTEEIEETGGDLFRDTFYGLNNGTPWDYNATFNTNFNLKNVPIYNFATGAGFPDNGKEYNLFRYGGNVSSTAIVPTKHSFYFYFGLYPSKTALDKMNVGYFGECKKIV